MGYHAVLCTPTVTPVGAAHGAASTHLVMSIDCPLCIVRMDTLQDQQPFFEFKEPRGGPNFVPYFSRFPPYLSGTRPNWLFRMFHFPVNTAFIKHHPNYPQLSRAFPGLQDFNAAFRPLANRTIDWWGQNPDNAIRVLREVHPGVYALLWGPGGLCAFNQASQA